MKTYWLLIFIILALFISLAFAFSCGEDEEEDDDPQEVWEDSTSGFMWQNTSFYFKNIGSGLENYGAPENHYCENLKWAGHSDWRLPSISELRSLIRGCEPTMTGGECKVTDDCLDEESCDKSCGSCPLISPAPGFNGMYWPPELKGACSTYLSSSMVTDYEPVDNEEMAWGVDFYDGSICSVGNGANHLRCVRDIE